MIQIDKDLIKDLFDKAVVSDRKRMNYDLRTSSSDRSQRMLNALLPGSIVPIHRHPNSNENVILLCGKLVEVIYEDPLQSPLKGDDSSRLVEKERIMLDPSVGNFGCVVPAGAWHTVEVLEPSVIYEAEDGKYGEDGSENFEASPQPSPKEREPKNAGSMKTLKEQITYLIGMERQSGSMEVCSPLYVSRMLNVPLEEVEKCMGSM